MESYEVVREDLGTGKNSLISLSNNRILWKSMLSEAHTFAEVDGVEIDQLWADEGEREATTN